MRYELRSINKTVQKAKGLAVVSGDEISSVSLDVQ